MHTFLFENQRIKISLIVQHLNYRCKCPRSHKKSKKVAARSCATSKTVYSLYEIKNSSGRSQRVAVLLLLPVSVPLHGTVVIPSGTSWPFVLPSQHKRPVYSVEELLAPGLWLPSWQIQVTKTSESPWFRWQNRGRANKGLFQQAMGEVNLCPQLLYISTPGLELCCIITVFKRIAE